jgi:hypothetical protein
MKVKFYGSFKPIGLAGTWIAQLIQHLAMGWLVQG